MVPLGDYTTQATVTIKVARLRENEKAPLQKAISKEKAVGANE